MIKILRRALTHLALAGCATLVLAAVGQPVQSPNPALGEAATAETSAWQPLPLAPDLLRSVSSEAVQADCDAADVGAAAVKEAASEALARSALRMRWLLTSPHASGRGCSATGCTG